SRSGVGLSHHRPDRRAGGARLSRLRRPFAQRDPRRSVAGFARGRGAVLLRVGRGPRRFHSGFPRLAHSRGTFMTLKVGVIGLGFFGSRHAQVYADHPAAELVGVADLDAARVAEVAGHTGATGHTDFRELLARPEIEAVSICLPDRLHETAAIAAAEAGKTILLEKPFAHDAATAGRIVEAVER